MGSCAGCARRSRRARRCDGLTRAVLAHARQGAARARGRRSRRQAGQSRARRLHAHTAHHPQRRPPRPHPLATSDHPLTLITVAPSPQRPFSPSFPPPLFVVPDLIWNPNPTPFAAQGTGAVPNAVRRPLGAPSRQRPPYGPQIKSGATEKGTPPPPPPHPRHPHSVIPALAAEPVPGPNGGIST